MLDKSPHKAHVIDCIKYYNHFLSRQVAPPSESEVIDSLLQEYHHVDDDTCDEQSVLESLMLALSKAKLFAKQHNTLLVNMVAQFYLKEWLVFRKDGKKKRVTSRVV